MENNKELSKRALEWVAFSDDVKSHIEQYTVPQYGDYPHDQATEWTAQQCVDSIKRYANRHGRNAREGQDLLDMIKIAHYACLACMKMLDKNDK